MDDKLINIKQIIEETLKENYIELDKIILFGSRARGDNRIDSDYDILVIINKSLERSVKFLIAKKIRVRLANYYINNNIFAGTDIIIKSISEKDYFKDKIGSITYSALNEGVFL